LNATGQRTLSFWSAVAGHRFPFRRREKVRNIIRGIVGRGSVEREIYLQPQHSRLQRRRYLLMKASLGLDVAENLFRLLAARIGVA
jgi:hypothetical protein